MTTPCPACPFRDGQHSPVLLEQLAAERIPCHMSCEKLEDADGFPEYVPTEKTLPCIGAIEWNGEKRP